MIKQKEIIEKFLDRNFTLFGDYTISDDGVVNVDGKVSLNASNFNKLNLTELPIQFGVVDGSFDFEYSNIETMKGFPDKIGLYHWCSIRNNINLKSFPKNMNKYNELYCDDSKNIQSLENLNCNKFVGHNLNLEKFGTNFTAKIFKFNNFPTPTADEMRYLIKLNPEFITYQKAPWIKLIKDYSQHKDIFRVAQEFEELYGEQLVKLEEALELKNNNWDLSL